jgi:uncharacterized protein (TIGR03083 family)
VVERRPLRQYYDGVPVVVDDDLPVLEPWLRHRRRLTAELGALDDDQWRSLTRCATWDARGVVSHLVTADGFFTMGLRSVVARDDPTSFMLGFDPTTGPDGFIASMREQPPEEILARLVGATEAMVTAVEALEGDDWEAPCEAPFGHLPARLVLAHAFWDSWLHERDILVPLGRAPAVERDEVLTALWFTLVVAGLQGGLLEDDALTGPGPERPIDVTLLFADLPDDPLRVEIDSEVRITRASHEDAVAVGAGIDLVEHATGRAPGRGHASLPPELADQLDRASQIL